MKGQIEASQLARRAFVYVRQSSMAQVLHHQESAMRQYDLQQRAVALGWAPEAIDVIDEDQARTATTTDGRSGFARLATAVAHGEAEPSQQEGPPRSRLPRACAPVPGTSAPSPARCSTAGAAGTAEKVQNPLAVHAVLAHLGRSEHPEPPGPTAIG